MANKKRAKTKENEAEPAKREYPLRDKRRRETRAAMIAAAGTLIAERGFNNVTMQEVADHAGMHAQTLYAHFPNKYALGAEAEMEAIRAAIVERKNDTLSFWRTWVKSAARTVQADDAVANYKQFILDQTARNTPVLRHPATNAFAVQLCV